AAELDGANSWQRFLHITLPMLKPTSIMILTTTFIGAFNLMIQPMIMTQGGPQNATMTPIYYIYRTGFTDRQLGYASAMSVIYGIIIIIFTIVQRKITKAGDDENE
ncbi:MAG: sugar ABC transporter permease, partial [Lactobacillus johnsonii]|nr:sugar ABC transporter permease [Lactobacillus johnsonii]